MHEIIVSFIFVKWKWKLFSFSILGYLTNFCIHECSFGLWKCSDDKGENFLSFSSSLTFIAWGINSLIFLNNKSYSIRFVLAYSYSNRPIWDSRELSEITNLAFGSYVFVRVYDFIVQYVIQRSCVRCTIAPWYRTLYRYSFYNRSNGFCALILSSFSRKIILCFSLKYDNLKAMKQPWMFGVV